MCGGVGIDAERGDGQAAQCALRKEVEETGGLVCLKDSLQGGQVGTGDRHLGDEAGGDEHLKGAQQFAVQVGNPEGVDGGR